MSLHDQLVKENRNVPRNMKDQLVAVHFSAEGGPFFGIFFFSDHNDSVYACYDKILFHIITRGYYTV